MLHKGIMKLIFWLFTMTIIYCADPSDVQKAFVENQVIPEVLTVAPKKILNASFSRIFN